MHATTKRRHHIRRSSKINAVKAAKNFPSPILFTKKTECDMNALKIVERLLEPGIEVEWLLNNLSQINRTHLEDVAEERAIVKLCAYVLCNNHLTKIVNKKYQISTLKNKVYDIEKIKNFCSYSCYIAMNHIMMQMLTTPLWLRNEKEIPVFTILPVSKQRSKSPPGIEVNILSFEFFEDDNNVGLSNNEMKSTTKVKYDRMGQTQTRKQYTEDAESYHVSVNSMSKTHNASEKNVELSDGIDPVLKKENLFITGVKSDNINYIRTQEQHKRNDESRQDETYIAHKFPHSNVRENEFDEILFVNKYSHIISDLQSYEDTSLLKLPTNISDLDVDSKLSQPEYFSEEFTIGQLDSKKKMGWWTNISDTSEISQENNITQTNLDGTKSTKISFKTLITRVEQSFTEWITENTINLLHGEDLQKQQIMDNVARQEKYSVLCHNLDYIQLQEEKRHLLVNEKGNLKSAPDYSVLKEQAQNLEVKMRVFYGHETNMKLPKKSENHSDQLVTEENIIPLTDVHDPRTQRRRIFLDKLNKVLLDLLDSLTDLNPTHHAYKSNKIITVKTLISTFDLTAENVIFQTAEWTLVGLIIIKVLGIVDPAIKSLLLTKKATTYMSIILRAYKLDPYYLDQLIISRTRSFKINYCNLNDESN